MKLKWMVPALMLALMTVSGCTSGQPDSAGENKNAQDEKEKLVALVAETETGLKEVDFNRDTGGSQKYEDYLTGRTLTVEEYMEESNLYGLSVAVYENYELKWSKAYGVRDLESKTPVDTNTVFSTASISKAYTGTLAAILEEKGMLDLDAPVNSYLKRWQLPDNEFTKATPVTLRHLLSHTAGTTVGGFADYGVEMDIPTTAQILAGESPAQNDPVVVDREVGKEWRYSGGGYVLAMMAIEDYTGERFEDLMDTYIFNPLGMTNSTFWQPDSGKFTDNAAAAHNEEGEMYPYKHPVTPELSASGLWSTAEELPLLLIDIQNALAGRESKVVSPEVAEYVTAEYLEGSKWGFPWALFRTWGNLEWFSYSGANTGIGGQVAATFEGGNAFAILGNGPNSIRVPLIEMLLRRIIDTHDWAKPESEVTDQ